MGLVTDSRLLGSRRAAPSRRLRVTVLLVTLGFAWPALTAAAGAPAAPYAPVDLGTLPGGSSSQALVVNDGGAVVGISSSSRSFEEAFWWTRSTGMVAIGTLGGSYSVPRAMNSEGLVVGTVATAGGWHAFLWSVGGGMV